MKIQRYSIFVDHPQELIVSFEHHLGDWCKSDDVAKLEAEKGELLAKKKQLEVENDRLRIALEIIVNDTSLSFVVQQIAKGALEE
jgi:hypothetical protein